MGERRFGRGWAEIERSRFGYRISAGYGTGVYEVSWFRLTRRGARIKAQRIVDKTNRWQRRQDERERLGYDGDLPEPDLSGGPVTSQIGEEG